MTVTRHRKFKPGTYLVGKGPNGGQIFQVIKRTTCYLTVHPHHGRWRRDDTFVCRSTSPQYRRKIVIWRGVEAIGANGMHLLANDLYSGPIRW